MLSRRDALRAFGLAGLAVAGIGTLTACGEGSPETAGAGSVGLAASDVRRKAGDARTMPEAVAAVQAFTADLYRAAAADTPENLVLSPYSVAIALAMVRNGAVGPTASEIDDVLHAPGRPPLDGGMNALTRHVESRAGEHELPEGETAEVDVSVASSLWGQRDLTWEQEFLDVLGREYGAGVRLVDYRADAEGARGLINEWTGEHTAGKIPELVPEGVLDELTRLVLVNAIHFKAPWKEPFEGEESDVPFTLTNGERVEVDMVSQQVGAASYAEGDGWVAAGLPYVGDELAMALIVPDDLADFEAELDGEVLADLLEGLSPQGPVRVVMPRWDFRSRVALNQVLAQLGMPRAFDPDRADFTAMTREERLHLTHVLHEATVTVDEKGTEAAAATAAVMGITSAPVGPPPEVVADRPFLFVIHDVTTATPLFVGRVADPR
jgi:serine protease inhibitor